MNTHECEPFAVGNDPTKKSERYPRHPVWVPHVRELVNDTLRGL